MTARRFDGVLFDLDGTLIDSRRDLAAAVNLLLIDLGLTPLLEEQVARLVGRGARSLMARAIEAADPDARAPRQEADLKRFLGHYERVMLESTVVFPGVWGGLERLAAAGMQLGIVTNKPSAPTDTILQALGLSSAIPVVVAGDTLAVRKPDPAPVLLAARLLGIPPSRCVMVGDSDIDVEAARAAGVTAVWCDWGGFQPDAPRSPDRCVSSFDELVTWVLESLNP